MIAARSVITKHGAIIIWIFIVGAYLTIKAIPENSWDGWQVGSAQALLSAKHWVNDSFFKNYFLFLPQGYSKVTRYFDDPELRQHARGITTGGFIGKRLYYTHYPFGYIIPTALLMKLGAESRFWFRLLQILFSLIGLVFLYWVFYLISNRLVASLGILFYSISTIFLDYADSLAAMPLEELLRPIIIFLSILSLKNNQKKYFNYLIWIFYFILSLSSYDSTFFIFAWLVGLDLIVSKKTNFKKWIFWVSAPILAFGVQILQNYLYLGWRDMILDFYGAFKVQLVGSRTNFFLTHLQRWFDPLGWFFGVKWYLGIIISVLGIWSLKFIKKYSDIQLDIRYLYLAFLALLFHFLFFPSLFFYQGRLVAIFGALLMGSLTSASIKEMIRVLKTNTSIQRCIVVFVIFIMVLGLWFIQGKRTYTYIKQWPNNIWPQASIDFDKKIKNLVSSDKVIFQLLGSERKVSDLDRYPMAASEDEYHTDAPILGFTNTADLIRDFNYLKQRSEFPFSAIIIANQKTIIEKLDQKLTDYKKTSIEKIGDKFIMVIL